MRYIWLLLLALLLPTPALGQNQIRLHWDRYDTVVNVNSDGSMQVQEQQVLVVDQGTLNFISRKFVTGENGRVTNIRVLEDGQPYSRGANTPGSYAGVDTGREAQIQLWFRDPSADRHSFTIEYTVNDALIARGDQATLDWSFFWSGDAPPIRDGSVEIRFPQQVNASELQLDASGAPVRLVSDRNPLRWELTEAVQGAELDVQATFPRAVLAVDAAFRASRSNTRPGGTVPFDRAPIPNQAPSTVPSAGVFNAVFCFMVLIFLFIAFSVIRASARARNIGGYPPAYGPGYGSDPLGGPLPRGRRRQRRYGGWGGGFFPPVIITPPNLPRDQSGPFNGPFDGSPGGGSSSWGDSGGSSSSWGDSGGSSTSWGDSGGGGSSWSDMGGGGSSWGGGGGGDSGGGDNGGSGGGSFG